ncbi:mitochondrial import receptor subunit TOM70 isoform 3-T3 [Amazona ochrocephala]
MRIILTRTPCGYTTAPAGGGGQTGPGRAAGGSACTTRALPPCSGCPVTLSLRSRPVPSRGRRCERVMAASKPVEAAGGGGAGLSRWQLALVLGAPILLGAGALYLWGRRAARRGGKGASERKTPEGRASPGPCGGGGGVQPDGPGHEETSPLDRAQAAKNKGNKYFKAGKYEQAIQCYTEAISLCPPEKNLDLSTFYQNRAAAYEQLQKWTEVAQDCTKAVELNPKYVKALFRRAKAHEKLDNKKECLEDVTAVCILEAFQNQQSMLLADKVLKLLGKEKAKEKYKLRANALIKRGSMYMQQQQPVLSTQDFNMAADIDPQNADVYHHRGQLKILLDQIEEAVEDFDECIRLRPDSALAQAQKCFALYRQAYTGSNALPVQVAMKGFEDVIKNFPKCAEGYALYAQALTDQQQFGKADEMYDKCIDLEPDNATTYVHKGLLQLQWKQDLDKGLELISKAIEIDNKCDFAYETMGTIEVQRGNLDKAIEMFNKAINLAKSEMEMAHLYSLCDAAYAQTEVAKKYGLKPPTL